MAFDITKTINAIASFLEARGEFSLVQIGEPKSPPQGEMSAAIFASDASVVGVTLQTTVEVHEVTIRIYRNMMDEPEEDNEIRTSQAVTGITSDLLSDYDLSSSVRNISIGEYGRTLSANWGYMDVGGTMYRSVDISVPFIVDGSATPVQ
jgi:hypothetical protein|tara:strand:+ start:28 stop:477 length:450 start_codon:yes stop_codon:yes gene_type:complete